MTSAVEEVLNELGWSDGSRIPIANAANKLLEEEIERKNHRRTELRRQLELEQERLSEIRRHATALGQERGQNARLLAAQSAQLETERQLCRMAEMEESRLGQESRRREHEAKETEGRAKALEQRAAKLGKKLEACKRSISVDKDSLANWEERLSHEEERNIVIEQFLKTDAKTFEKVELERKTLSEKAETYRRTVLKADTDVRELELMLDKSARYYNQAVKDRRQLMDQWSQSVHVLTQRDKVIYEALQEIESLRQTAKERMESYQESDRFYDMQVAENRELEHGLKMLEKELAHQRDERLRLTDSIDELSIEFMAKNKTMQEVERRIGDLRRNLKRKRAEMQEKKEHLDDTKRRIGELKESLKTIDSQTMDVEERVRQLRDMLDKEDKRKANIIKAVKRMQDLILRANTQLKDLEAERDLIRRDQQVETRRMEKLVPDKANHERMLRASKEQTYHVDVELQRCEIRLAVMLGEERDAEELEAKRRRIEQLSRQLKEKSETSKTLQAQLAQVENEVRRITAAIGSNEEELRQLRDKRCELGLLIDGGEKQLRAARTSYEERRLEESILRLKLRESERLLTRLDDRLYDLEKLALEMEAVMQERRSEIRAQRESLGLERRAAQADCAELRAMIAERRTRVQQLQCKYDILTAALGNPDELLELVEGLPVKSEDGQPLPVATLLKIQSAQEQSMLTERGDKLDKAIRKAEHEIRSMENTLRLVNACNVKFKSSLSLVDEFGKERAEMRALEDQLGQLMDKYKRKLQELDRYELDRKRMEENCARMDEEVERCKEEKESKLQTVRELEQVVTEQTEKILRADKNLKRILKEIENKCGCVGTEAILLQERDVALRELQELNQLALQRIAEFSIRHVEAEAYVRKLLEERNLSIPSVYYMRQPSSRCASSLQSSRTIGRPTTRDTVGSVYHFDPKLPSDIVSDSVRTGKSSVRTTTSQSQRKKG